MAALDLVDWPADRTLALSGSARALRLPIVVRNDSAEPVRIAEASLVDVRSADTGSPLRLEPIPIQMSLAGHGVGQARVRLGLPPATPPGRYTGEVRLGGLTRMVAIDVLPEVKLEVRPTPVVVDAGHGQKQRIAAAFENLGNVPLTIDLSGVYPLAEEAPTAPDGLDRAQQTENPLARVLDTLTGRTPSPVLVPFGVLELAMPGGVQRLEPGETCMAEVAVKLPGRLSPSVRYHAFAPLYATDLHIVVVTAAKSAHLSRPRRTKGAAA